MLRNQPTNAPTRKVKTGGFSGAAAAVLIYLAGLGGLELSPEVAAAIVVVVGTIVAYFTKERA